MFIQVPISTQSLFHPEEPEGSEKKCSIQKREMKVPILEKENGNPKKLGIIHRIQQMK